ncbi:MAG: hypothetical protein NTV06_01050 [candidate division Zixibacteria bacterium]|nr:hypothetical protein [candidate division Zixibacteria bacterium]
MKKVIGLIIIGLLLTGCSRYIDSEELSQKLPERPPVPNHLIIAHLADGLRLSWQVSDTAAVKMFRVYSSDSLNGYYGILDSTEDFSFTTRNLVNGGSYFFKVASVTTGHLEGPMSPVISSRFGTLSMVINGNDRYTRSQNITVSFVAPIAVVLMQLSEDMTFSGAHWENFAPAINKTLSAGDGVKGFYARFQFGDGSESVDPIGDSIILDTKASIDSIYFETVPYPSGGDILTFYLISGEQGGTAQVVFSGVDHLPLYDDGTNGDSVADDGIYTRRYTIPIDLNITNGVVAGLFTDEAGNIADRRTAPTLLTITQQPPPVTLMATGQTSSSISLSWSQSQETNFSAYHIYRNSDSTVSNSSQLITIISSRTTLIYNDINLDDNTSYYYRIYVYDNTGLYSISEVAMAKTAVNLPPVAVKLAVRVEDSSSILTWTTNNDDDFESYLVYADTISGFSDITGRLLSIINSRTTTNFTDIRHDTLKYYYKVYVYDKQGLSAGSDEVSAP